MSVGSFAIGRELDASLLVASFRLPFCSSVALFTFLNMKSFLGAGSEYSYQLNFRPLQLMGVAVDVHGNRHMA